MFSEMVSSQADIWEGRGVLCRVEKELTLSRSLAIALNSDAPLPQPQTQLQPPQHVSPHLFDMYPRLSPATRLSLTPSRGLTAWSSLWKQSQPGPHTRGTTLYGCYKPLVQSHSGSLDTTPLPNNCQSRAVGLERLSQGPGGASCHNFAQGVGLSCRKLWSCERGPNPSPRPISSRDEWRRSQGDEKCPALLSLSAPGDCIKKIFVVAFDLKEESGPFGGCYVTFICVC